MNTPQIITAETAARLVETGAILIDIRAGDEYRRRHIAGARSAPLDRLPDGVPDGRTVIFHCQSGLRTGAHTARLAAVVQGQAYILAGGLNAWAKQGLPVIEDRRQPLEIMRQVQIVAGTLILTGVLLGALLNPAFYALAGFVGAGLLTAGITGFCGMARLLSWLNTRFRYYETTSEPRPG